MYRRIGILLLTLSFIVSCADRGAMENSLRVALGERLKGFDPAHAGDEISTIVQGQIYEPLFQYSYLKRPFQLEPLLAESMPEVSSDKKIYIIKIKKNVFFQDDPCFPDGKGREVTAEDFVYSFKRIADANNTSTGWWIFDGRIKGLNQFREKTLKNKNPDYDEPVEGLKAIDRYTLRIELVEPYPQIMYVLAMPYTAVVSREAVEKYGEEFLNHPVGTGPFRLAKMIAGSEIILERNPNFREEKYPSKGEPEDLTNGLLKDSGKNLPFVDKIRFTIILEDQPFWLNFLKGRLDFGGIPKDNFSSAITVNRTLTDELKNKGIKLIIRSRPSIYYIGFNMKDPILGKNKYLRQAMSCAFDRNRYIELFSNGRAVEAHQPVPPDFDGYDPSLKNPYTYNLKKAEELLAKAGYPGGKGLPVLEYDIGSTDTTSRQSAEYFMNQMKKIGITVKVNQYTWTQFLDRIKTASSQIFGLGWVADYPDAENFLQLFYGPNSSPGANNSNYDNPEFNRLYETIRVMSPSPERTALYKKMSRIIVEDCPWILLVYPISYGLFYDWILNYKPMDFAHNLFKYYKVDYNLRKERLMGGKKK